MSAATDPTGPPTSDSEGAAAPDEQEAPAGPTWGPTMIGALVNLPSRLTVLFFWLTLVVSVTVLLGMFTPIVVLPATLAAALLTWRLTPDPVAPTRDALVGSVVALVGVVGWVLAGLRYTAEVLLVERDPGFLTLEGLWLSHNANPDVPIRTAADVLTAVPGISATSDAFWLDGSALNAQGAKAFPALIATLGWVGGQPAVLAANVLIGGLALLAFYDLARRLLSPLWGLLPVAALALTTPMLHFTRTPFTEPTNIVLTFGGLAVAWGALRRPRTGMFGLAGAMLGATALARIDGAAVAAGLMLGLGLVAAGSREPSRRRALQRGFAAATASALAMVVLGYLDVQVNSTGYLVEHRSLYVPLVAMLLASLMAAVLAILVGPRLRDWVHEHRHGLGRLAAGGVLVAAVVMASRPLWLEAHSIDPESPVASFVAALQGAAGLPVDGTRGYDEQTLTWLAWYLGPLTVILAAVGAALMLRESIERRRASLLVLLATLGVPALLYLLRPSITPDQVWAMRRFLPAAMPLVLLCASWLLQRGADWTRQWRRRPGRAPWAAPVAVAILVLACLQCLIAPTVTWGQLVRQVEYAGRADQVAQLCEVVRGSRVVVVRGAESPWLPTLRIVCDVDVVELEAPASADELATIRAAWGPGRVLVLAGLPRTIPWSADEASTMTDRIIRWPHSLIPVGSPVPFTSSLWIGEIQADGAVRPVTRPAG